MAILGLSYDFHDASAALVMRGGLLAAAAAEERFTLQKHDASFPKLAVDACLKLADLQTSSLDAVAFYEQPHEKFTRVLDDTFRKYPRGGVAFAKSMKSWLGGKLWQRGAIARELGIRQSKVQFFPHHTSHAAQCFCPSPFDESAILIVDGVGEWGATTLLHATRDPQNFRIIEEYEYPRSLGLVYAAFTGFLGFKPNSGESSVMALAAFGKPRYVDRVERVLRRLPDDTYEVDATHFDFLGGESHLFRDSFCALFGSPRDVRRKFPFDALTDFQPVVDAEDQYHADVAASLQVVLTDVLLGLCRRLRRSTGASDLCFGGGVAMNCLANTELMRHAGFERIFIPSDPGDGGAAIGAAYLAAGSSARQPATPYLGSLPRGELIDGLLESPYLMHVAAEAGGSVQPPLEGLDITVAHDEADLVATVAADLHAGRIVGWVQGRFELGPRALGNRSLLVDPGNLEAVRRMSRLVKSHVLFRPYALSIATEAAQLVIECPYLDQPVLKWMQTIWPVRDEVRSLVRGGVHVDGTTRPQLCSRDDNPLYWALLNAFSAYSGLPVVLNTSFNERSMPIVANSLAALASFLRTGIDTLAVDRFLIRKRLS
jgi:carbamoyltransferase